MIKRVLKWTAGKAARGADAVANSAEDAARFLRLGPRGYRSDRELYRRADERRGVTFSNGVTTSLTTDRAVAWHHRHWRPTVIVLLGDDATGLVPLLRSWHGRLHAHFFVSPAVAESLSGVDPIIYTPCEFVTDAATTDLRDILDEVQRLWRRCDVVLLDLAQARPSSLDIIRLQHAAYEYHHDLSVGFVTPGHLVDGATVSGWDFDRESEDWAASTKPRLDFGQNSIARYVLTAPAHSFYLTSSSIDRLNFDEGSLEGLRLDAQVGMIVAAAWRQNLRTLCFPNVVVELDHWPELAQPQPERLLNRVTRGPDGRLRIIFVLNATSISGGIRAVFEIANGLSDRGHDVEIWSLQGTPDWFDLRVPIRTFRTMEDMLLRLRKVDAVKVATWWESAEIVWLATVNHGIPVYLVQEFETWFYPDDAEARAAVAASYRREFNTITEANYQVGELEGVGISATMIPHGYDPAAFHQLPGFVRSDDTLLAVGRSFFQKNFAMTLRAWRSLGDARPRMLLFGSEPDIVIDERVTYVERPLDSEVNELYNTGTVFVQTSRHEGFCLPILEAMAAGCPVITTDSHGNDFCVDGENCIMVPQDDDVALAAAITALLADRAEQERLRAAGLATAAVYNWPVILERVEEFYLRVAR